VTTPLRTESPQPITPSGTGLPFLGFLAELTALDVPLFVACPTDGDNYRRPDGWPSFTADGNGERLCRWQPGYAVMACCGGRVVVIDIDPRNGGDVNAVMEVLTELGVRIFAEIATPGGGAHLYVAGHPDIASAHSSIRSWPGVDLQSFGINVYLPGTLRVKWGGKGYRIDTDDLDALAAVGDPDGAQALAGWLAEHREAKADNGPPAPQWTGASSMTPYLRKVLDNTVTELRAVPEGQWNNELNTRAFKLGQFVAGAGLPEADARAALADGCRANDGRAPDSGSRATINSGLRGGALNPKAPSEGARSESNSNVATPAGFQRRPNGAVYAPSAMNGSARPAPAATLGKLIENETSLFNLRQDPPSTNGTPSEMNGSQTHGRTISITWANTIEPAPVVWAWEEDGCKRIPAGSLVTCAGREGTGKSSFGIWLAAHISRGTLPGSFFGTPKRVLYAALEDSWKYTLVPRLTAAGADLSMIGRVDVVTEENAIGTLSLPSDGLGLESAIIANDVALLVVDPLMSVMNASIDTYKAHEVRSALEPLVAMADRTSAIVAGIAHFNKGKGADVASLITGSGAFKDVPRAVLGFAKDDDGSRVMSQVKNSLGIDELPSLGYQILQAVVPTPTGPAETGLFVWTGESDRSVMDILSGDKDPDSDDDSVGSWIKKYLRSRGGSAPAREVYAAGEEQGFKGEMIKKARYLAKNPKIRTAKTGFAGAWIWSISNSAGGTEVPPLAPSAPSPDPWPVKGVDLPQGAKVPEVAPSETVGERSGGDVIEGAIEGAIPGGERNPGTLGTLAPSQLFEHTHEGAQGGQQFHSPREVAPSSASVLKIARGHFACSNCGKADFWNSTWPEDGGLCLRCGPAVAKQAERKQSS